MKNPPLILIADDDADFKEILSAKFLSFGYQIAEASDGLEAITKAKSLIPDLIIMDIQMPNVNGTEAVLELKHTPETKDVKIVFFSSLIYPWPGVKSENPEFAKELGAITFMKKSDDLEKIATTVKGLLTAPTTAA
jgi:CheY-like chemotaxis protein